MSDQPSGSSVPRCGRLFGQSYTISTIAGGGAAGTSLNNPTSVAVDIAGNVYFGDWSGFIRKIWALDGVITSVAGTGMLGYKLEMEGRLPSAMLGKVSGIAIDNRGNICIADTDNQSHLASRGINRDHHDDRRYRFVNIRWRRRASSNEPTSDSEKHGHL